MSDQLYSGAYQKRFYIMVLRLLMLLIKLQFSKQMTKTDKHNIEETYRLHDEMNHGSDGMEELFLPKPK